MYDCNDVWDSGSDRRAIVRSASWPFFGRELHVIFSRLFSGGGGSLIAVDELLEAECIALCAGTSGLQSSSDF